MISSKFQPEKINYSKILANCGTDGDGAVVAFIGSARNKTGEKSVEYLEYELYDGMAQNELEEIVDIAVNRWELNCCNVVHRYGKVNIGEATIVIVLSAPHREEAYDASRFIIDTIKKRVPIWKKEVYSDGSHWVGSGS